MNINLEGITEFISYVMPSKYLSDNKKGQRKPTMRAQCGLVGANDCKYSRGQRLNVPFEARRGSI
jgi:hypothetical protein